MATTDILAIDCHAHYGDCTDKNPHTNYCMSADAATVVERATASRIQFTIASPLLGLFPRGKADAVKGNEEAARIVPQTPGLLQLAIVNPLQPETFEQARQMLQSRTCVGLKFHPEEHRYPITEHGEKLFAFAAQMRASVMVHSGEALSLPDDYVVFANRYPEMKLLLAHIGCSHVGDLTIQCRAIQKSRHGNVWADTSSAMSIIPRNIEWTVSQVGAERVCFGTDTPLYVTAMQRARIDHAELTDQQKRLILRENAFNLFPKLALHVGQAMATA
ncbi:MAG: amidohydrolase family protein [Phycisphaeraceae bacterium]|nr:amidohydrolase family protein [Phycisphaeraceae bacterium]